MKNFKIGQTVITPPHNREGILKRVDGLHAIVWFDKDGNDVGYYSLSTLIFKPQQ